MAPRAARHRRSVKRRVIAGVSVAATAGIAVTATVTMNAEAAWTSASNVSASGWMADDSPRVSVDRQGDAPQGTVLEAVHDQGHAAILAGKARKSKPS